MTCFPTGQPAAPSACASASAVGPPGTELACTLPPAAGPAAGPVGAQSSTEGECTSSPSVAPPQRAAVVRAVLFDFDMTLTVLEGIAVHRVFPERGFGGEINVDWVREKAFGGRQRVARLGDMLQALTACGVELHIVSFAERAIIVRALAVLGVLHYFCDRIVGWEELGAGTGAKVNFIRNLAADAGWRSCEILFVDDQERNFTGANGITMTHLVRGCGLSEDEMSEIVQKVVDGVPPRTPSCCSSTAMPSTIASQKRTITSVQAADSGEMDEKRNVVRKVRSGAIETRFSSTVATTSSMRLSSPHDALSFEV
eukprot:gnl/TRDRNA2_/TRDRNA2_185325_c0_seq1.p1 gnl/TRDRNA2_/TRDRNA2_185325_c0~~gnl/TRDRNA2_/TRDRNA2_185325_c0_seq1.p1  ORF type:complete len:313 (-),score=48.61 gnl/TRDRNA2_/TRDRNA2_185325_c0_seq1:115-1053(-)